MIIVFKPTVDGVLLACGSLADHPGSTLMVAKDGRQLKEKLRFSGIEDQIVRVGFDPSTNTSRLLKNVFTNTWTRISPLDPGPLKYIDLVLRHGDADPEDLVRLLWSCNGDVNAMYSKKTRISLRYYNYMREVTRSWQRLCMFSRPSFTNGLLFAEVDSPHEISDIFCRWLARKNPDVPVAVVTDGTAWIGNGEFVGLEHFTTISAAFVENLQGSADDEGIDELWDVYYDSQMIEKRRNRGLAKKMQPLGSSTLSKMARRDRYKVERGISSCTLDGFI
ncbi:MAG: DUF4130 domain-containing protein [Methanosarcinaceae archaeon]|nr:DUF4130 domain-containing protein [Methanosarcinaceae archaeon]